MDTSPAHVRQTEALSAAGSDWTRNIGRRCRRSLLDETLTHCAAILASARVASKREC